MTVEAPVALAEGAGDRRRGAAMGVPGAAVLRAGHPGRDAATEALLVQAEGVEHGIAAERTKGLTGVADTMGDGLGAPAVHLRPGKGGAGGAHLRVPRNAGPRAGTGKSRGRSAAGLAR